MGPALTPTTHWILMSAPALRSVPTPARHALERGVGPTLVACHRPQAFCVLRDLFQTAEHWQWGIMSKPTPAIVTRLTNPAGEHSRPILLTYYIQYQLHCQLLEASRYANSKRVVLKGDLPIGVDKRSVETWLYPKLFRMDCGTGAPPDYFDANGQNWGFPT